MRAVGATGYVVNGAEASALDVVEIDGGGVAWTVFLPHGGAGETFRSDDPAVVEFVRRVIAFRTLPDPARPTSAAATRA